jgi:hypothetical protein
MTPPAMRARLDQHELFSIHGRIAIIDLPRRCGLNKKLKAAMGWSKVLIGASNGSNL